MEFKDLFSLNETIAEDLLNKEQFLWDVLPKIKQYIIELGKKLDSNMYECIEENIWVAKNAKIAKTSFIAGPTIIDENAEIRHCAYIRGGVIVGKNSVVGNSTELKNCILFNNVQVPHYNYIGDSILGFKAHFGAGSITSNVKSDKTNVIINKSLNTNLKKVGAFVGDYAEIGCNSVLNPGTIIGKSSRIYPLSCVRGIIPENCIYKDFNNIIKINTSGGNN